MKVDPDDLETAGAVHLKALADAYDDLVIDVAQSTRDRAEAFTGNGRSTALLLAFDDAYEIFYTFIYQTGVNIRAMGLTLVDFAENHRMTDREVERTFEEHEEDIDGERKTHRSMGADRPNSPDRKDEPMPYNRGGV
ncbi:hypothetical protein [Glycomyces sp. NPDC048151]|uniref:hypothetical protein n=1 Tax=Glycomyces sp. NPDC048151 TaxID=3364002 RepID=UPI00371495BD